MSHIDNLQQETPSLTYEEWKQQLIKITAEKGNIEESHVKINDESAREWYDDGFTPYATFRENFSNIAPTR